ncbi:enoyl-CoA hydratase/isomerase family protein [Streptomyces sp. NPDC005356]|uniref:enoyl-CoA hydratase/isomerase family protein n=1 Tax=unclassified Streptomyces TaxID=2593676 RepID=UPI0033BE805E
MQYEDLAPDLLVTAEGPLRLVELNRPEQLNSMSDLLHSGLAALWDRIAADEEARAVILTGRGRAFSAGGNFEVMTRVQRDAGFREQNVVEARRIVTGMLRCPVPVIAAVNGPAVGLGTSLALLSDLVLISEKAYFADPHLGVGLVPGDGGALALPLLVGPLRAKELLFFGSRVDPQDAVRLGLANRVVAPDKLLDEARELADRLARLPVQAVRDTKRLVNLHLEQAAAVVLEPSLMAERQSMASAEHIDLVAELIARHEKKAGTGKEKAQ